MPIVSRFRSIILTAACAGLLAPAARAQAVDAAGAQALQQQVQDWFANLVGPGVKTLPSLVQVTPQGDHYLLSLPVAGPAGTSGYTVTGGPWTASVKPLDGTRWAITDMPIPSPLRIENPAPPKGAPRAFGLKGGEQTAKGVLDTSLATTSTLDGTVKDVTTVIESDEMVQTSHVGSATTHTVWEPTADGRLNMAQDVAARNFSLTAVSKDGTKIVATADRQTFVNHARNVDLHRMPDLIHAVISFGPAMAAAADAPGKPPGMAPLRPEQKASARAMVLAMRDLMGGFDGEFGFDKLRVDGPGATAFIDHLGLATGFGATEGKLDTTLAITADGIDSPQIPPGPTRDYLPRHIVFKQHIGGVSSQGVVDLALHAIDSDGKDQAALDAEGERLIAGGPLVIGIDELSMDMGPASITSNGTLQVVSSAKATGHAEVVATGLDALLKKMTATPALKQGVPVLIFLKGIGRQEGNKTIWSIDYTDAGLTVNGTDMSSLIPHGK